jgi:monoamine oxidase
LDFDIIIVGAGMAGLTAGRVLANSGQRVGIIEARHRVGGRICTTHVDDGAGRQDVPIELGAEFVHGLPPETWSLLREARLATYEIDGVELCSSGGALQIHQHNGGGISVLEHMLAWEAALAPDCDMTFAAYLGTIAIDQAARTRAVEYVEGFNAADSAVISVKALAMQQRAEDAIDSDRLFKLEHGYAGLPRFLARQIEAAGGSILLGSVAQRIGWRRAAASVSGVGPHGDGFALAAKRALICVPLGVLQANAIEFMPDPGTILLQARRLAMGPLMRMTLLFRSRFWAASDLPKRSVEVRAGLDRLSFLFTHGTLPSTWWTPMPDTAAMITAWVGGTKVALIESAPGTAAKPEALLKHCLATLGNALGVATTDLTQLLLSWHCHDWQADPYTRGAYSYVPAGAIDASAKLTEPVEDTLYFAGEHTDISGHWGTVHAAVRSGLRAAAQLQGGTR